jgi:glycosyltransferase involved in cell wall biosynthesis
VAGPRVEFTGFVPDLRPHLAAAVAVVVPLRLGGGTRLKIVEAMAVGKAIVSATLGSEGIEAVPGRDILIEDQPAAFADAVNRLLADPNLARRLASRRGDWRCSDIPGVERPRRWRASTARFCRSAREGSASALLFFETIPRIDARLVRIPNTEASISK